ncbi:MAG: DUF58 domain-containing protein [Thermoplasmatota archaeon]
MGAEMIGFSSRAVGYGSASIVLLVLSLILSSELFLISSVICLTMVLLSMSFIPKRPAIERRMDRDHIFEGEQVGVDVKVEGRPGPGNLEIFDALSPNVLLKDTSNCSLLPPGRAEFRYELEAPLRGYHRIGPTSVRRWDPLWMWFSENPGSRFDQLTVFPTLSPDAGGEMTVKRFQHRPGEMKLKRVGMGKEFHSIRDYTTTDPFNTINWKAYARTGKLLVNQFEAESVTDIVFIIDSRMVTRVGTMVENPLEASIRLTASMSSRFLTSSNRVGLIIYGSTVSVFKPRGGPTALQSILHDLVNVTPSGYNTMGSAVEYSLPYLPPNVPIIMLSPLSEDPTIREAVRALIGRGHSLTIVSPAGIEYERIVYLGKLTPRYLLKRLGRENLIKDLRSMGAKIIDWTPDKDLIRIMEEVWM